MRQAESDGAFGCIRPEHLVKHRLEEENAKSIQNAYDGEKNDAEHPLECIGHTVTNEAEETPHAAWTASRHDRSRLCSGWDPIPIL
jgi:hypothetical protein